MEEGLAKQDNVLVLKFLCAGINKELIKMNPIWYSAISFLSGLCIVFIGLSFFTQQNYKPVLIIHGVLTHYTSMNDLANRIREVMRVDLNT